MPVEFDGKRYEQTSAHQKEWGTRLIQGLNLRGDERILDVGCGDGALTANLAEAVPGMYRPSLIRVDLRKDKLLTYPVI